MKPMQARLNKLLERLDASAKKIVETRGYTREVNTIRLLEEMIKEQIGHENPRPATRTLR